MHCGGEGDRQVPLKSNAISSCQPLDPPSNPPFYLFLKQADGCGLTDLHRPTLMAPRGLPIFCGLHDHCAAVLNRRTGCSGICRRPPGPRAMPADRHAATRARPRTSRMGPLRQDPAGRHRPRLHHRHNLPPGAGTPLLAIGALPRNRASG
jgi:hypothetical protein